MNTHETLYEKVVLIQGKLTTLIKERNFLRELHTESMSLVRNLEQKSTTPEEQRKIAESKQRLTEAKERMEHDVQKEFERLKSKLIVLQSQSKRGE